MSVSVDVNLWAIPVGHTLILDPYSVGYSHGFRIFQLLFDW